MIIEGNKNDLQQNEDWKIARMGRFSCSQLSRLMAEPKSKSETISAAAKTYVQECVAEKITGLRAKDDFTSKYTEWGNDNEPIAKGIYNEVMNVKIADSSYIPHDYNFGGSPDGLIGTDGIIEIKCPYTITAHLDHIMGDISKEYHWQMIGYLIITGREWIDFVSYHPGYPGKYQFKRTRILRSNVLNDIENAIDKINKTNEYLYLILNSI